MSLHDSAVVKPDKPRHHYLENGWKLNQSDHPIKATSTSTSRKEGCAWEFRLYLESAERDSNHQPKGEVSVSTSGCLSTPPLLSVKYAERWLSSIAVLFVTNRELIKKNYTNRWRNGGPVPKSRGRPSAYWHLLLNSRTTSLNSACKIKSPTANSDIVFIENYQSFFWEKETKWTSPAVSRVWDGDHWDLGTSSIMILACHSPLEDRASLQYTDAPKPENRGKTVYNFHSEWTGYKT